MNDTIYDHPLYYDILFSWDRTPEADFYESVFRSAGVGDGCRVLEVACGTGQVARHLARRGFALTGLDNSEGMLAFLRDAAGKEGVKIETLRADMTSFASDPFDAAYNPMSSFRLLHEDAQAEAHLRAMAAALRPGGVYLLDMTLLGDDDEEGVTTDEEWEMERGDVTVRAANDGVHVTDAGSERTLAWGAEGHLRDYRSDAFIALLERVPALAIASWHPESGHNEDGVTLFDTRTRNTPPIAGRTMVALRRVATI